MTDLERLAAAIEAGTIGQFRNLDSEFGHGNGIHAKRAYNGSLDAAKALHDAVLPGWIYLIRSQVVGVSSSDHDDPVWYNKIHTGTPARAWLLAIVRALIAKEGKE